MSYQGLRRPGRMHPAPDAPAVYPRSMESGQKQGSSSDTDGTRVPDLGSPRPQQDTIPPGSLPPIGLLLSRPLLLLLCGISGALIGLITTGNSGYQATAEIEFSATGVDSLLVKQTGQTLARTAVSERVLAATGGESEADLANRISAAWQTDTRVVNITATATTPEAAIADANAVAEAVVTTAEESIRERLTAARNGSNELLKAETLNSPDAEAARRAQLGNSLGARQDAVSSESSALVVSDPASEASAAGLTKPMGVGIGLVGGLLLGGLLSVLLGVRGLRARSARTVHYLFPDADLRSPGDAAQIAGEIVESGTTCVAIVSMDGTQQPSGLLASEIARFVRANGTSVRELGPMSTADGDAGIELLRRDVRDDLHGRTGAEVLVVTVSSDSEAATLLQGQSNLRALVVLRRGGTRISAIHRSMRAFSRAQPVLVLVR